jgi:hypothetical protein
VPVDRLGQAPPASRPIDAPGAATKLKIADRLRLLGGLREHRHDHPEDDRGGHRAADALHEARADEHLLALGDAAEQGGDGEDGQAARNIAGGR